MLIIQPLRHGLGHLLYATLPEGRLESGQFNQLQEGQSASFLAEPEVICPGLLVVLLVADPELEGADLGQHIIDIVERRSEDMVLFQPESAGLQEGVAFAVAVGEVCFFQLEPGLVALLR